MRETTLTFGLHDALLGTVSFAAPAIGAAPWGVLLFNAGVIHRVGAHRTNVKLARLLAAQGIAALRFDLHGMGDSQRADGSLSYKEQVVADLRAAMDALQSNTGVQRFALVGFCSGALPSYWTAQADPRVSAIVLYDAFSYPTARSVLRSLGMRLRRHGVGPRAWSAWLRAALRGGHAALHHAGRTLAAWRASASPQTSDDGTAPDTRLDRLELGKNLLALAQRGTGVMVLSAGTDFSAVNYAGQLRQALGLQRQHHQRLIFAHLPDVDHAVTTRAAQQQWLSCVRDGLLRLAPSSALPASP